MSHFHNPPRQNVHRARKPRTEPRAGKAPAKPSKANAAFNEHARRANAPGAVATAGQLVGAGVKLN
jgi:hypothetical protein